MAGQWYQFLNPISLRVAAIFAFALPVCGFSGSAKIECEAPTKRRSVCCAKHQSLPRRDYDLRCLPTVTDIMKRDSDARLFNTAMGVGCIPQFRTWQTRLAIKDGCRRCCRPRVASRRLTFISPRHPHRTGGQRAVGAGILYTELGQDCVPAANVGAFRPKPAGRAPQRSDEFCRVSPPEWNQPPLQDVIEPA
jgi:hypothetical protein